MITIFMDFSTKVLTVLKYWNILLAVSYTHLDVYKRQAVAILLLGFELIRTSFHKILQPEAVSFSWLSVIILLFSISVKLWICLLYTSRRKSVVSQKPLWI